VPSGAKFEEIPCVRRRRQKQDVRPAAVWIYAHTDSSNEKTLCITSDCDCVDTACRADTNRLHPADSRESRQRVNASRACRETDDARTIFWNEQRRHRARADERSAGTDQVQRDLAQCARVVLLPLGDDGRRAVLRERAQRRGLILDEAALEWLLKRVGRDLAGLTGLLDRLDRASLAAQRRITVPFLREVLEADRS